MNTHIICIYVYEGLRKDVKDNFIPATSHSLEQYFVPRLTFLESLIINQNKMRKSQSKSIIKLPKGHKLYNKTSNFITTQVNYQF